MTDYEERLKKIHALCCYFEDDRIFKDFLDAIEKLGGNEANYYYSLEALLRRIVYHNSGVPLDPTKKDGKKESSLLTVNNMNIKVIFQKEESKNQPKLTQYEISVIEIYENGTLKGWPLKRYSSN